MTEYLSEFVLGAVEYLWSEDYFRHYHPQSKYVLLLAVLELRLFLLLASEMSEDLGSHVGESVTGKMVWIGREVPGLQIFLL